MAVQEISWKEIVPIPHQFLESFPWVPDWAESTVFSFYEVTPLITQTTSDSYQSQQSKNLNTPEEDSPSGDQIRSQTDEFPQKYKIQTFIIVTILLLQSILIVAFFVLPRRCRKRNIGLLESESTARMLLSIPTETIILLNTEETILDANEAVTRRFNISRKMLSIPAYGICFHQT